MGTRADRDLSDADLYQQMSAAQYRIGVGVRDLAHSFESEIFDAIDRVRDRVDIFGAVRRAPIKHVAMAAAVGVVGGLLVGRSRDVRQPEIARSSTDFRGLPAVPRAQAWSAIFLPIFVELARHITSNRHSR